MSLFNNYLLSEWTQEVNKYLLSIFYVLRSCKACLLASVWPTPWLGGKLFSNSWYLFPCKGNPISNPPGLSLTLYPQIVEWVVLEVNWGRINRVCYAEPHTSSSWQLATFVSAPPGAGSSSAPIQHCPGPGGVDCLILDQLPSWLSSLAKPNYSLSVIYMIFWLPSVTLYLSLDLFRTQVEGGVLFTGLPQRPQMPLKKQGKAVASSLVWSHWNPRV